MSQHYLDHVLVLVFELLVGVAVLEDGEEGQGTFEATAPARHRPPGQPGRQLAPKPGGFGIHNPIRLPSFWTENQNRYEPLKIRETRISRAGFSSF